ncbi:MAG TPA: hypothetical protein VFM82_12260 [Flavobacteriaceae bacterium]|nr:hypothetical protein [Flavobacteriaceae bacterium]
MKNCFFPLLILLIFFGCSSDDARIKNPNLLDINFQFSLDMTLPQYSSLQFPSNPVYVNGPNYGNKGVIIINTGNTFRAFDASDPNHPPSSCSLLLINGIEANCGCDDGNTYNLFTGQPTSANLQYPLYEYRVEQNGNILYVSN